MKVMVRITQSWKYHATELKYERPGFFCTIGYYNSWEP